MQVLSRSTHVKQRGQGMTEYIIIVALIAIAAIGVYSFFGQTVRQQTADPAQDRSGKVASKETAGAQKAATDAPDKAGPAKGMGDSKNAGVDK